MASITEKSKLRKQLLSITKGINVEGLLFLIEQANIIKYNEEVEKANKSVTTSKSTNIIKSSSNIKTDDFLIEAEKDKSSFIFILRNSRKFVTRSEMKSIVKIASNKNSKELYAFLLKERSDILKDCSIKSNEDLILQKMIKTISSKYKTK